MRLVRAGKLLIMIGLGNGKRLGGDKGISVQIGFDSGIDSYTQVNDSECKFAEW